MRRLRLLVLSVLCAHTGSATAQPATTTGAGDYRPLKHWHHTTWRQRHGLPIAGVNSIQRTPDGYLWLGSNGALFRFDGMRFVRFDGNNIPALRSAQPGSLTPLMVDRAGTLWISRRDGGMVTYRNAEFREVLSADRKRGVVTSMAESHDGLLWMGSVRLWVLNNGVPADAPVPRHVRDSVVMGVTPDTGGGVWIGMRSGEMWHYGRAGARRTPENELGRGDTRALLQSRDGAVWALDSGVSRYQRNVRVPIRARTSNFPFIGMRAAELPDSSVVIGTRGHGIVRWIGGAIDQFTERDGLSDAVVRDVLVDADGSLWVATDAGLDRFRRAPFVTIGKNEMPPDLSPGIITPARDGTLWVAGSGSYHVYRIDGGIVNSRYPEIRVREATSLLGQPARFTLQSAARGSGVWLTDDRERLSLLRDNSLTTMQTGHVRKRVILSVLEDRHGGVWTASADAQEFGVVRQGTFRPIRLPGVTEDSWVSNVVQDSSEAIWVVLQNPAIVFKLAGDSVVEQYQIPGHEGDQIQEIVVQGRDSIWLAVGGKLGRIVNQRATSIGIPELEAVLRSSGATLAVSRNHLWFASASGIARVALAVLHSQADGKAGTQPAVRWFNDLDGLSTARLISLNAPNAFAGADGRLWFGTPDGVAVVNPASTESKLPPPIVHIEEIVTPDSTYRAVSQLELPAHTDRAEIHFTATGLFIPERVRLQYRLEGSDNAWIDATSSRTATYTQLRHGDYKFLVRAWNEGDVPGEPVSMQLSVLPMWYEAVWFAPLMVALLALLGSIMVYIAFRARTGIVADRMRARYDAESAERARLARELHDTLLQGFTGITLQLQAVRQSVVASPKEAEETLDRILTTADVSLREARMMVWDMRAPELDNQTLVHAVHSAATSAVAGASIELECRVEGSERRLPLGVETAVLRVAREAVANAVKHASATKIGISLLYETRKLTLTVQDDGRGFDTQAIDANANGGHWGLKGMQERAARAGGTFDVRSIPGEGTTIELVMNIPQPS